MILCTGMYPSSTTLHGHILSHCLAKPDGLFNYVNKSITRHLEGWIRWNQGTASSCSSVRVGGLAHGRVFVLFAKDKKQLLHLKPPPACSCFTSTFHPHRPLPRRKEGRARDATRRVVDVARMDECGCVLCSARAFAPPFPSPFAARRFEPPYVSRGP